MSKVKKTGFMRPRVISELRRLKARAEKQLERLSKDRDALRETLSDLEDIAQHADSAVVDVENAIQRMDDAVETLSQLL